GYRGPVPAPACAAAAGRLCLGGTRFAVTTEWVLPDAGAGTGTVFPLTADTGAFWFFQAANLEMLVKVLDACAVNVRYWVFAAGRPEWQVVPPVVDTPPGAARRYVNPQGAAFAPLQDTAAFSCP